MNLPQFRVAVVRRVKRVTIIGRVRHGTQTHRGWGHVVWLAGERIPHTFPNCFHQKRPAAQRCGEAYARRLLREKNGETP